MRVTAALILISTLWLLGCGSDTDSKQRAKPAIQKPEAPVENIVVNVCKSDPKNADTWRQMGHINLFTDPALATRRKLGEIPACSDVSVDVLKKTTYDGVRFYKVRYAGIEGWQTKRLLTGED